jgi:hypothetical protein
MFIQNNIYKDPKYKWIDIVQFDRARDGGYSTTYGWSKTGYGNASGLNRSMGARLIRGGSVLEYGTAWTDESINSQYLQFSNLTQSGDKLQAKFDPTKLVRFWYRYAGISQILFDTSNCPLLREISLRKNYGLVHGDLDLSGSPLLEVFEISSNASINSVTFHNSAPLELVYVSGTSMSGTVIDSIMEQCVNGGVTNGSFSNDVKNTAAGCNYAQTLLDRGWTISTYELCADTVSPTFQNNGFNNGLYISDEGDNYLMCHWKVTDDTQVTSHRIYYKPSGGSWSYVTYTQTEPDDNYDYQLTGLDPGTSYDVYVRSYDAAGNYTDSTSYTRSTTGTAPDTTPPTFNTQPYVQSYGSDNIQIAWSTSDNVARLNHKAYYRQCGNTVWVLAATLSATASGYTYTGLSMDTCYEMYVEVEDTSNNTTDSNVGTQTTLLILGGNISVNPNPYNNVSSGSTTITVSVTANENWSIGQAHPDLTVLGQTSTGGYNADVDIRVDANTSTSDRSLAMNFYLDSDVNNDVDLIINQFGDSGGGGSSTS